MLTSCNIQVCKRPEMKIVPGISKPVVVTYSTQGMSIDAGNCSSYRSETFGN